MVWLGKLHDGPAALVGHRGEFGVGVDGDRDADELQHGEIVVRIAVGEGQGEVVVLRGCDLGDRSGLLLAVAERLGQSPGVGSVDHLGFGGNRARESELIGQLLHDLDR